MSVADTRRVTFVVIQSQMKCLNGDRMMSL